MTTFIVSVEFVEMFAIVQGNFRCIYMSAAWIIYLNFFFLNEFSPASFTGFGFCCHWRQKCWPFRAEDHIFHLILVCSDERKAVFSPQRAERVSAHPCHQPPFHRAGVNARATLYIMAFLPGAHGAPQWAGSPAACLPATSDECSAENTGMDSDHLSSLCACILRSRQPMLIMTGLWLIKIEFSEFSGYIFSVWLRLIAQLSTCFFINNDLFDFHKCQLRFTLAVQFHYLNLGSQYGDAKASFWSEVFWFVCYIAFRIPCPFVYRICVIFSLSAMPLFMSAIWNTQMIFFIILFFCKYS